MSLKVALLVDFENVTSEYISQIFHIAQSYGKIIIKRAYGHIQNYPKWKEVCKQKSIQVIVPPANNKNAADILLTIDTMDLFYQKNIDIFFIVSNDSDFTSLAARLLNSKKIVIGLGDSLSSSMKKTCSCYYYLSKQKSNFKNTTNYLLYLIYSILLVKEKVSYKQLNQILIYKHKIDYRIYRCNNLKQFLNSYTKNINLKNGFYELYLTKNQTLAIRTTLKKLNIWSLDELIYKILLEYSELGINSLNHILKCKYKTSVENYGYSSIRGFVNEHNKLFFITQNKISLIQGE